MKNKNEKKAKINEKKSSLFFNIVLSLVFVCAFVFVWFAGYVYADTRFEQRRETTSVMIALEPAEEILQVMEYEPEKEVVFVENMPIEEGEYFIENIEDDVWPADENEAFEMQEVIVPLEAETVEKSIRSGEEEIQNDVQNEPVFEVEDAEEPVIQKAAEETPFYVAIVIDDMGVSKKRTEDILSIQAPLTSSFLTYGKNLEGFLQKALAAGHEVMMHTPMEPKVEADLAPDTLKISMSDEEIEKAFSDMLAKFEGVEIKGINNHMGSLFTESAPKLDVVMKALKEKNLFFLDSKTSEYSQGEKVAALEDVAYVARDVFLDNENDYEKIKSQLSKLEKKAQKNGVAIGICHPKSQTFAALKDWLQTLGDKNIKLVHLSDIVGLKYKKNEK